MSRRISATCLAAGPILLGLTTMALAGGIERTNQSLGIMFEPGTVLEFTAIGLDPNVKGTVSGTSTGGSIFSSQFLYGFGFKTDITQNLSVGFILDEPYGAILKYPLTGTSLVGGSKGWISTSNSLTFAARYRFDNNFSVVGAVRAVDLEAELHQYVGGVPIYDLTTKGGYNFGYSIGIAYEIPELARRISLTYNSEIDNNLGLNQVIAGVPIYEKRNIKLPDSLNIEFQTGITPDTLLFGSVRYVDWKDFVVASAAYTAAYNSSITRYEYATLTNTLGLARVLTPDWTVFGAVTYEAGHNPTLQLLGPVDGFAALSGGFIYSFEKLRVTTTVTHVWLGDAQGKTENGFLTGVFKNNDAWQFSTKLAYHF